MKTLKTKNKKHSDNNNNTNSLEYIFERFMVVMSDVVLASMSCNFSSNPYGGMLSIIWETISMLHATKRFAMYLRWSRNYAKTAHLVAIKAKVEFDSKQFRAKHITSEKVWICINI